MKHFCIRTLAMILAQPLAMWLFLRVLHCGFFVAGGLAALMAMLVGLGVFLIQRRIGARGRSL